MMDPILGGLIGIGLLIVGIAVVMKRSVRAEFGKFQLELKPNGGSSLRDAIDRIELNQKIHSVETNARLTVIESQLGLSKLDS